MARGEVTRALPVYRVSPPYGELRPLTVSARATVPLPPGTVVLVSGRDRAVDWSRLQRRVRSIRRSFPESPTVLLVPRSADAYYTHLAGRASALHVRAVLIEGEPLAETLRRELTEVPDLGTEVDEWLCLVGLPMSPATEKCIAGIFRASPGYTRMAELAKATRTPMRTIRGWFQGDDLPPPSRWIGVARTLRACLRLQRFRAEALLETSLEAGYCDASALSRQLDRLFGLPVSAVRDLLGWEWVLARWLAREGCLTSYGGAATLHAELT